jgi:hypothetical protein
MDVNRLAYGSLYIMMRAMTMVAAGYEIDLLAMAWTNLVQGTQPLLLVAARYGGLCLAAGIVFSGCLRLRAALTGVNA